MSKKQLPVSTAFKQSDNPKVPLPKKPKSKRKITSNRRVKPVNKNLSAPILASHLPNDADASSASRSGEVQRSILASHLPNDADAPQTVPGEKERQEPRAYARN